jgi:excisionase family DNA binding protein
VSSRLGAHARTDPDRDLTIRREDALSAILTPMEAARLLGLGRSAMYERLRTGEIPHKRLGRKYLISRLVLARFVSGEQWEHGEGGKP